MQISATTSAAAADRSQRRPLAIGRLVVSTPVLLVAITLVGLGLRLAWVASEETTIVGGDPLWYHTVATNIAEGRGYVIDWTDARLEVAGPGKPTAFWPPGYPIALGGVYKAFGVDVDAAQVFNALLGALAIPLVFLLGRTLAGDRVGLVGALICALLPEPIVASVLLISEFLFTVLFLAALVVLARRPRGSGVWAAVAFGALAGLAVLTRGQGLVLLPVAVVFWLARDGLRSGGRSLALAALAFVLVLTPWTVRNAVVMDGFVPVATSAGINLRIGHSPDSVGNMIWPETIDETDEGSAFYYAMQPDQETRRSEIYADRAWEYAREHPSEELDLAVQKLSWLFRSDPDEWIVQIETLGTTPVEPEWLAEPLETVLAVSHYALLALAALSLPFWIARRGSSVVLLSSVVVFYALFHVPFFAQPRFHLPLLPVLAVAAAWPLVASWSALARR
jgi:4-amino-4-deoxy-L-arabinose transferase-like glycosyltransferase